MYVVSFNIIDGEGHSSKTRVYLPGISVATLEAWSNTAAIALGGIITGAITSVTATRLINQFVAPIPDANSDIEIKARIVFGAANTSKRVVQSIPTFNRALLIPGTDRVNLSSAEVNDWIDLMTHGVTVSGTLVQPVDSEGRDILSVVSALEAYGR